MEKVDAAAVRLAPMTDEMYRSFFREYESDPDLLMEGQPYVPYVFSEEKVERYIRRQKELGRVPLAILYDGEIAGEIVIKDIEAKKSATMGLTLKNAGYKDRGIGTAAEKLAIRFVFEELDIPVLYADALLTNTRSLHVLEKAGFVPIREDGQFRYYKVEREQARFI